jgi:hypothetical protein
MHYNLVTYNECGTVRVNGFYEGWARLIISGGSAWFE